MSSTHTPKPHAPSFELFCNENSIKSKIVFYGFGGPRSVSIIESMNQKYRQIWLNRISQ